MDIFNRERVLELENKLAAMEAENKSLRVALGHAESKIQNVLEMKESMPDSCTPGDYCRACIYADTYYYVSRIREAWGTTLTGIMCLKGRACPNFIQKENLE